MINSLFEWRLDHQGVFQRSGCHSAQLVLVGLTGKKFKYFHFAFSNEKMYVILLFYSRKSVIFVIFVLLVHNLCCNDYIYVNIY